MSSAGIPDKEDLGVCGDCGARAEHGALMHILKKPRGYWAVCGGCMSRSLRDATDGRERAARRLAKLEARGKNTHNKARVGSHLE